MASARADRGWLAWAALATIYIVWGSTYLAIRVMVETIPPLLGAGFRFAFAGAAFLTVLSLRGGAGRVRVSRRQLGAAALVGTLLCFGGNGLVTVAEQDVPSGLAALVIGSVPLWVVILRLIDRQRVPSATLAGVMLGFAGLAVLVLPGDRPGDAPLWGVLLIVAAAILWASGSFYSTRLPLPDDALVSTAWQMLLGGLGMIIVGFIAGEGSGLDLSAFSGDSILAFSYLTVVGALLAYTAYTWLLRNAPISTVATYAYVNPVIAIFLGWAILSEEITATVVAGAVLIVVSVAAVVREESRKAVGGRRSAVGRVEGLTAAEQQR
jgi:drug/metabolite transporter (DMT)-like permease